MLYVLVFILFDKITINLYLSIFSTHWTASNFKTIQVKIKKIERQNIQILIFSLHQKELQLKNYIPRISM